ncbi:hypothetical protein [Parasporobacterium paucivorans]|nr:hypothetical protein [Parasporobacterium paucivorans]
MEKRKKVKKINVIISAFFVEAGISILAGMSAFNRNNAKLVEIIQGKEISRKNLTSLVKSAREVRLDIQADAECLQKLSVVLSKYSGYTLDMLGNDNLLEHDSFTDMLWAVFHVNDELKTRGDCKELGEADIAHIENDIKRAYSALILEWIKYMGYLQEEYPFLHAAALRKNPFSEGN